MSSGNKNRRVKEKASSFETAGYKVFYAFLVLFMVLFSVVMLYPYLNVVAKAFNQGYDTIRGGVTIYPRVFTLDNFNVIFKTDMIVNSMFISVSRVVLGTFLALVVQFSAAFAFKKKSLKGRGLMLIYLTIPMFFGGGLIPLYLLYSQIGFLNKFWVYVVPGAFSLFNMVIIRTYLYTIPDSFEESAKLDGANEIVVMLRIIVPLAMPILATIALWTAVGHWNDWTTTLYFVTKSKLFTLQYMLMRLLRESDELKRMIELAIMSGKSINAGSVQRPRPESIQAAQIVLTTIPIIIVYPFLQKYFIKGIMIGGIKD